MSEQFAFLLNTGLDDVAQTLNAFEYALDLAQAGHDVRVYLDGAATQWPAQLAAHPDSPVAAHYKRVRELDLIAGACGLCAVEHDSVAEVESAGIDILGDRSSHGIVPHQLVADGYTLHVIG